ncbi:hypothetical protein HF521_016882 [Silurus meridionalis]|uniref:Uncharacterized protein n=1 Tax=Silurus meridionalis TaxID=175797 RepID=A0A8T0BLL6_SILME|nr:hypothetical protein HF521_016882 [Silurus meridionalis]
MKSDDLKRVELRLQTADGLLRRNISTTREVAAGWGQTGKLIEQKSSRGRSPLTQYWVTYVPVVVNMTASSPEEQMLGTKRRGMNEKWYPICDIIGDLIMVQNDL